MILGQNGIWGDLLKISLEGQELYGRLLGWYKQVRADVNGAFPVRNGSMSSNPEIHEKIGKSGRGVVCAFTDNPGTFRYVTSGRVDAKVRSSDARANIAILPDGRAEINFIFESKGAKIVFFGAE
jgi:hypothetical protein